MIPQGGQIQNDSISVQQQPSRTYRLNHNTMKISGTVDGLEAVKQAVFKILQTERFEHLIYGFDYGREFSNLSSMAQAEIQNRMEEALKQDDRITGIKNVQFDFNGDEMVVQFTVISQFGDFNEEVNLSV
ncbi:DUF2634 domain-containing protein [Chengkuizengella sp. SCS-71B]|uniref:DUF2634 domain-containing protein n=1 Tax=Chengkuizengella sp. SCS-71B TaxID=3115290 RepID=UPI0032C244D5